MKIKEASIYLTGSKEHSAATQRVKRLVTDSQSSGAGHHVVIKKPQHISLHAYTNCSLPNALLGSFSEEDGHTLFTFSMTGDYETTPVTTLSSCTMYLTSQANYVISAVLLEHSPCTSGVFVLLWDNVTSRRWDVCSAWHAPGPSFTTSSNMAEVSIELNDVTDPCDFNISILAVDNSSKGKLELRYLSPNEGKAWVNALVVDVKLLNGRRVGG